MCRHSDDQHNAYYKAALILCTTPTPTLCLVAILWMPCLPCCRAFAIAASILAGIRGRPIGLPLLVPLSRARAMPAMMRYFKIRAQNAPRMTSGLRSYPAGETESLAGHGRPFGLPE